MVARLVQQIGIGHVGIGSDLCQGHPDSVVEWMRSGRWTRQVDFGEGSKDDAGFPSQPSWFRDNRDFPNLERGLAAVGFSQDEIAGIVGQNWLDFFDRSFGPALVGVAH
jgi:microsomal dipeptidase-like Zn-dependent dipeptidase